MVLVMARLAPTGVRFPGGNLMRPAAAMGRQSPHEVTQACALTLLNPVIRNLCQKTCSDNICQSGDANRFSRRVEHADKGVFRGFRAWHGTC